MFPSGNSWRSVRRAKKYRFIRHTKISVNIGKPGFLVERPTHYSLVVLEKVLFSTRNQQQALNSVGSKTKLPSRPKSECNLSKFTTVQVYLIRQVKVSQLRKIRIKNHQSQPTSVTFSTARETYAVHHRLAHFILLSDALSSCV